MATHDSDTPIIVRSLSVPALKKQAKMKRVVDERNPGLSVAKMKKKLDYDDEKSKKIARRQAKPVQISCPTMKTHSSRR